MASDYPVNIKKEYILDTTGLDTIQFGKELKEKEFHLRQGTSFLNNGSFGAVPKRIIKLQNEYNLEREEHPDLWFRFNVKEHWDKARAAVANFIHAKVDNTILVPNVTTAMNMFIREFPFKKGDAILDNNKTYGSVSYIVEDYTQRMNPDVEHIIMELNFPIKSEEDVINRFKAEMDKHPNIKVVILDHVTSPSSIVMPIKKLVEFFHSRDVAVFIDGAHAIGQIPLDMEDIKADGYTTNLHKWCFTPRGCAVLYFDEKHADWIKPPVTSWNFRKSVDLQFFDQGTGDHVPFLCGRHGVEFYQAIGGVEKATAYTKNLADKAVELICNDHGLEKMSLPPSMEAPNLRMIKLPPIPDYSTAERANMWFLQTQLFGESNVYGLLFANENDWYFRICVQVYNELSEYEEASRLLGPFIKKYCKPITAA